MITVSILINGEPIFTRSARNQGTVTDDGYTKYITCANDSLWHRRESGAVELAKMMLDTINEEMTLGEDLKASLNLELLKAKAALKALEGE